jgi:hypothetical protein
MFEICAVVVSISSSSHHVNRFGVRADRKREVSRGGLVQLDAGVLDLCWKPADGAVTL